MADGFHIASGWISVDADLSGFQSQVDAAVANAGGTVVVPVEPDASGFSDQVTAAVAGAGGDVTIPVDPDASGFSDEVDAAVAGAGGTVTVPVVPDASGFSEEVDAAVSGAGGTVPVPVEPDASGFQLLLEAQLGGAGGESVSVPVVPDATGFSAEVAADVSGAGGEVSVPVTPDASGFGSQLEAQLGAAGGAESVSVPVTPDASGFREELAAEVAGAGGDGGVSVPVTPDTSRFRSLLTSEASSAAHDAGSQAGGIFGNAFVSGTTFGKGGAIVTGVGTALATLPALAGVAGTAMGAILAAKMAESILSKNPELEAAFKSIGPQMMATLQQAVAPLVPVILHAVEQVSGFLRQIEPQLRSLFASIGPVIMPVLRSIESLAGPLIGFMKAAVQGLEPLFTALHLLVAGVMPGLTRIVSDAGPALAAFARVLGTVGSALGKMLSAMAPAVQKSAVVFLEIGKAISGLLPVIGKLAGSFATALAPVITSLVGAFRALEPAITIIGRVLGSLASAVLSSISGVLVTLGNLIRATAPAFKALAEAVSHVFTVLENRGVLFDLEDAFEKMAGPLATFINALVKGLVPILPLVIGFLGKIAGVLSQQMADALGQLLPSLTQLVTSLTQGLAQILPVILPLFTKLAALITSKLADAISDIARALSVITQVIPPKVLAGIALAIGGIVVAVKSWAAIQAILDAELTANPIGLVVTAIGALVVAIVEVVKHWHDIETAFKDAWNHILAFIKQWWPLLLGAVTGGLGLVVGAVVKYHAQIWNAIQSAWNTVYGFVKSVLDKIVSAFLNWTLPGLVIKYHQQILNAITDAWNAIFAFFKSVINKITSFFVSSWNTILANIRSAWNSISDWLHSWWNTLTSWVTGKVTGLVSALRSAWNTVLSDARSIWNNIQGAIQNVWSATAGWVTGHIDSFLGAVKSKWQSLLSDAQQAWNKLEGIFKAPVNFLIQTVYMGGIRRLWDDVVNAVGASGLDLPAVATLARGGKLEGYGGGDKHPALLESGETVVSKEHSRLPHMVAAFKEAGVPGYAAGGKVGNPAPAGKSAVAPDTSGGLPGEAEAIAKMILAASTGNMTAFTNAFTSVVSPLFGGGGAAGGYAKLMVATPVHLVTDAIKGAWKKLTAAAAGGAGGDIVSYARSFLGKIPYHWGGTDLGGSGCDCSGFTEGVYNHFGYMGIPRTSEAQGAWVDKITKPQAGGLVFFNSPAGGPPPGHVGIITSATGMISQAGPEGALGPTLGSLSGNMFMGIPPGGFRAKQPPGHSAGGLIGTGVYDDGGWLMPGATLAVNGTGVPERVSPPGGGGHSISVNYYGPQMPTPEQEAAMLAKLAHAVGIAG